MKASLQITRHNNDNSNDDDNIPVAVVVELVVAGEGELTSVTHGQGEEDLRSCRAPNLGEINIKTSTFYLLIINIHIIVLQLLPVRIDQLSHALHCSLEW